MFQKDVRDPESQDVLSEAHSPKISINWDTCSINENFREQNILNYYLIRDAFQIDEFLKILHLEILGDRRIFLF